MAYFYYRCGERITLTNENCTALRNDSEFDHGMVITADPLTNDVLFEIRIDKKVHSWSGSLEIGVTDIHPEDFVFPPCASKLQCGAWMLAGNSVLKDGVLLIERYTTDLDKLEQDERVGVMRTSDGDLIFYINGEPQGVAVENVPPVLYALVDLYGKCVQVTITNPPGREHNNDECMSGSSVLGIDNDLLNVTLAGDLSELSLSSSNSLDIRMDMNVSLGLPEEEMPTAQRQIPQRLHFHDRCGSLIKLSNSQRTAERRRPLDEFNNGVVMTHRPLADSELFEIRIDRLVDKWSGSIEMGVTTHDPDSLVFPATMTNMRSGTIMMSGCGILTNGKGTRREYGEYNLDELSEGDRVGLMRQPNGDLHYFINGLDQGIAAPQVAPIIWGVIDLYGMTIKVSLVDRDPREVQNLITRRTIREQQTSVSPEPIDFYEPLTFHPNCGSHAEVINNGKTAHRPNATDDFNNGVVLTSRPLRAGELFEVRLERVITKWAGSIEIGVTTHSAKELEFPFTMTNVRSGTWMMTGSGIMHNGTTVLENYGTNLDRLQVSDRVGVMRKENGNLHFFVNGNDQGVAASNVVENVYGVIDLYGQAVEATIIDEDHPTSADTSVSNTTLYSELRFHHIHGKNARVINNGMTAVRPRPQAEFNDAIVFSNRPLRDDEIFEVVLDNTVDRWSGSIELGVTSMKPEEIDLPGTATDLCRDTWLLSGTTVMENGVTVKNDYNLDLDGLSAGVRIGVVRTSDKTLEFYLDGIAQGPACEVPSGNLYAVVDLYGRCAQISVHRSTPTNLPGINQIGSCIRSDTSPSLQATSVVLQQPLEPTDLHRLSEYCSKGITISDNGCLAIRSKDIYHGLVYSATPLANDELFEISIISITSYIAGSISIGVTPTIPDPTSSIIPPESCYLTANELHFKNKIIQLFAPNLNWLRENDRLGVLKTHETIKIFINGEEIYVNFPQIPETLYVFVDLSGSCSKIQVTSRKIPVTPLTNAMLQDSLEIVLDQEPNSLEAPIASEEHTSLEILCCTPTKYEFHDNHGRNIEISGDKTVAKRVASYNQGIVIAYPALIPNQIMQIQIEQLDARWNSSIMCGVVSGQPEKLNLPGTAISMKGNCCIIANDWISINGLKSQSTCGERLNMLKPGSTLGLMITETGLHIFINGECEDVLPWIPNENQQSFAIFDLYGQCQQIKIFNEFEEESLASGSSQDCEKADLEICEKEQRPNTEHLTLPIATTSNNNATTTAVLPKISPITPIKSTTPCAYQEECVAFKKTLYLPDEFFSLEEPTCICNNCYKIMRLDIEGYKDSHVIGWVKFPLKNLNNTPTDMWHLAYYGSKLSTIRCILDKGQPLTKDQMKYSNLIGQRPDDVQISFSPSLQHCDIAPFKLSDGKEISAAFQLLVKPGSYSHSRNAIEWSTKETGAVVLHALLLKIS